MASTRRAVIAGGGAMAAAIATSAAALAETESFDPTLLSQIADVESAHLQAQTNYEAAIAAFVAATPQPHWSINCDDPGRALCGSWSSARQTRFAELKPNLMPTNETLDRDLSACADHFPERYASYSRLTRRLKARIKRRQDLIEKAERHFRLEELETRRNAAEQRIIELIDKVFELPPRTQAVVQAQAKMLVVFATAVGPQSWAYCHAGAHGRQLAANVLALKEV